MLISNSATEKKVPREKINVKFWANDEEKPGLLQPGSGVIIQASKEKEKKNNKGKKKGKG